jgi:hypothetical protein
MTYEYLPLVILVEAFARGMMVEMTVRLGKVYFVNMTKLIF